jgi:hypothetical protein
MSASAANVPRQPNNISSSEQNLYKNIILHYQSYKNYFKNNIDNVEKLKITMKAIKECLNYVMSNLYQDNVYMQNIDSIKLSNKKHKRFQENATVNNIRTYMTLIYIYRYELGILLMPNTSITGGGMFKNVSYKMFYRNQANNTITNDRHDILKDMKYGQTSSKNTFLNSLLKKTNINDIYYITWNFINDGLHSKEEKNVQIYASKLIISLYIFQLNIFTKYKNKHRDDARYLNDIHNEQLQQINNYALSDKYFFNAYNGMINGNTHVYEPDNEWGSNVFPSSSISSSHSSQASRPQAYSIPSTSSSHSSQASQLVGGDKRKSKNIFN